MKAELLFPACGAAGLRGTLTIRLDSTTPPILVQMRRPRRGPILLNASKKDKHFLERQLVEDREGYDYHLGEDVLAMAFCPVMKGKGRNQRQ